MLNGLVCQSRVAGNYQAFIAMRIVRADPISHPFTEAEKPPPASGKGWGTLAVLCGTEKAGKPGAPGCSLAPLR
jgi:hypothetical protein